MSDQDATNPEAPEVETEVLDQAPVETETPELDAEGNPVETQEAEDDTEEVEHNGEKYRIPKALKPALLMQADYTRKTQELAETRRTVEARQAELQQQAEAQQLTLEKRVQLATVDQQLQAYQSLNWQEYAGQYGAEAATAAMAQWQALRDHRSSLSEDISREEQDYRLQRERVSATALQEADQLLARELPGYSPELVSKVAQVAVSVGFTAEDVKDSLIGPDGKADTRSFKLLARLATAESRVAELEAKQTKAQITAKQAAVQPAKTVGQKAGGYKPGLDDSLPADEWLRRRNAQVRNRA